MLNMGSPLAVSAVFSVQGIDLVPHVSIDREHWLAMRLAINITA
jgi:hypothetical protein